MCTSWKRLKQCVVAIVVICMALIQMPQVTVFAGAEATVSAKASVGKTTIYADETDTVKLNITGTPGTTTTAVPTDIVLIMDRSGSMAGTNMTALKEASTNFVDKIDLSVHRIGVISYGSNFTRNIGFSTDKNAIKSAINGITATGSTYIGPAITDAVNMLNSDKRTDAQPVIIIITDGQATDSAATRTAAELARTNNFIFYTIGLYENEANVSDPSTWEYTSNQLLEDMATTAEHHHFVGPDGLVNTYAQIAGEIGIENPRNVKITQTISDNFELVKGSADANIPRPTIEGNKLTWEMLELKTKLSLNYQIKPVDGLAAGTYDYASDLVITYETYDGTEKTLTVTPGQITVNEVPEPQVTSITPTSGLVGVATNVKAYAKDGYYGPSFKVTVGGKEAELGNNCSSYFKFKTPTDLAAGTYDVKVYWGNKNKVIGQYTYTEEEPNPPLEITGMSPTSAEVGNSTLVKATVTDPIYASDFAVTVGGKAVEVSTKCSSYFKFRTPSDLAAGTYDVIVTNDGYQINAGTFTYTEPAPEPPITITGLTPTEGEVGVATTVKGMVEDPTYYSDFAVTVGGEAVEVSTKCSTYFKFKVPTDLSAGTYDVIVTNDGYQINAGTFTYTEPTPAPPMNITGLSVNSSEEGVSTLVKAYVTSPSYESDFSVTVGGEAVEVSTKCSSYFKFRTPSDLPVGTYDVIVTNGRTQTNAGTFTYIAKVPDPLPTVTSISPASAEEGTSTLVKAYVDDMPYKDDFAVTVGGKVVEVGTKCSSYFKFTTPSDLVAGTYDIIMTNDGQQVIIGTFTYTVKAPEPVPTVTSITPNTAVEGTATVVKAYVDDMPYKDDFAVTVGGEAVEVSTKCSSYFKFTTPSDLSVGTYDIVMTNDGQQSTIGTFTYTAKPTDPPIEVTAISVTSGTAGVATTVKVTASKTKYDSEFAVTVGGEIAPVTQKTSKYFKFKTPTNLSAGTYDIVVYNGTGAAPVVIGSYTFK